MADVQTNRCFFALAADITDVDTTITRSSAASGLPGDSNGPASGTYKLTVTDGSNFEIMQVTGGQGTTSLTVSRAVEAISGDVTDDVPNPHAFEAASPTNCYATLTAADVGAGGFDNPMTTSGDMIVGGTAGAAERLGGPGQPQVLIGTGALANSVSFDGVSGDMTSPYQAPGAAEGSLMLWIKVPESWEDPDPRIVGTADAQASDEGMVLGAGLSESYGPVEAVIKLTGGAGFVELTDPGGRNPSAGDWVCYVFVYDGTNVNLYRQGVNVATALGYGTIQASSQDFFVANGSAGSPNAANGLMAHAAYWDGVGLSPSEVHDLYSNASTMNEAEYESYVEGLSPTVYFPMQETSGATATNQGSTGSGDDGTYSGGYILAQPGPLSTGDSSVAWSPAVVTSPGSATAIPLVSGTPWQNTTGFDVILAIPIDFSATGTAEIQRGASSPGSTLGTITSAAGDNLVPEYYVPASWYITVTLASATFPADATAQPV